MMAMANLQKDWRCTTQVLFCRSTMLFWIT